MNNTEKLAKNPIVPFLVKFCDGVNKAIAMYWKEQGLTFNNPEKVMVHNVGGKYIRLGVYTERPEFSGNLVCGSVYCFVDATNGDVLKAGGWKAPAPKGVRGNVKDKDVFKCAGIHGLQYLGGSNGHSVADYLAKA